ncbi:hypothetical protein AMTRI_Chr01g128970 [Amborella trichopoda]
MANGAVTFFLQKVDTLLTQEVQLLSRVLDDIVWLRDELGTMNAFMEDVEKKKSTYGLVKAWVEQVREVMYDAEDILDEFMIKMENQQRFFNKIIIHHQVGTKIKGIKARIHSIAQRRNTYDIHRKEDEGTSSNSALFKGEYLLRAHPFINEEDIVGLQKDVNSWWDVVSLMGMGGIGKTTLAKKVYQMEETKRHFDCRSWIEREINPSLERMDNEQLQKCLYLYVADKKFLLVLDCVWSETLCNDIIASLHNCNIGSKIILTTRLSGVASSVQVRNWSHNLQPSEEEDAWSLLCRRIVRYYNDMPPHLKYCFLYCSLWIAEGFIDVRQGLMMEEAANNFLKELIDRNMIHVKKVRATQRPRARWIDDVICELVCSISENKNFGKILINKDTISHEKTCRLHIYQESIPSFTCKLHLRSLFIHSMGQLSYSLDRIVSKLRLLRVLHLGGSLVHLRYLGLRDTGLWEFPKSMRNLCTLQTLDAKGSNMESFPNWILELQNLTHLVIGRKKPSKKHPFSSDILVPCQIGLGGLTQFQTLQYIKLRYLKLQDMEELEQFGGIRKGSMAFLHSLVIWGCLSLKVLDESFQNPTSLQELPIGNMPEKFTRRLQRNVGEDYFKVHHVPNIYRFC